MNRQNKRQSTQGIMTKQNYVILGIILIIVFVLAGAVLVREKQKEPAPIPQKPPISQPPVITPPPIVTPPTNPTSPTTSTPEGWKTYENKEFGFAFDYPGDWEVEEKKESKEYLLYELKLWAPDQKDEQLREEFGPRATITISRGNTLEQFQKSIENTEEIKLPVGIKGYHKKDQISEWLSVYNNGQVIVFGAQQDTSLNMDIVNTFRLIVEGN